MTLWHIKAYKETIGVIDMKKKILGGTSSVFSVISFIAYLALHAYYTYLAFTAFKVWFAILVLIIPAGGDLLLVGASIYNGNWVPLIVGGGSIVLWCISSAIAHAADKAE